MIEVSGVKCHTTYFLANRDVKLGLLDCMIHTGDLMLGSSENL